MSDDVFSCPFCGGEAHEAGRVNHNSVRCSKCRASIGQSGIGMGDAVVRWNTRAALAGTIAASQTPPDHKRAAFEFRMGGANVKRDAHGNYVNEFVRCKWWGWCAHADEVRETGVKQ